MLAGVRLLNKEKMTKRTQKKLAYRIAELMITFFLIVLACMVVRPLLPKPVLLSAFVYAETLEPIEHNLEHYKPEQRLVVKEIYEVFGQHADKAMLLLLGRGSNTCRENPRLDPAAVNRNWVEGKPGVYSSSDWGIFQINDHWQGVTNTKFLTDYKINIRMAWRIFENNGYSFGVWTCGKYWGI